MFLFGLILSGFRRNLVFLTAGFLKRIACTDMTAKNACFRLLGFQREQVFNAPNVGFQRSLRRRTLRPSVERIRRKALLPFGSQERISRIQSSSAESSRQAFKGWYSSGACEGIRHSKKRKKTRRDQFQRNRKSISIAKFNLLTSGTLGDRPLAL